MNYMSRKYIIISKCLQIGNYLFIIWHLEMSVSVGTTRFNVYAIYANQTISMFQFQFQLINIELGLILQYCACAWGSIIML